MRNSFHCVMTLVPVKHTYVIHRVLLFFSLSGGLCMVTRAQPIHSHADVSSCCITVYGRYIATDVYMARLDCNCIQLQQYVFYCTFMFIWHVLIQSWYLKNLHIYLFCQISVIIFIYYSIFKYQWHRLQKSRINCALIMNHNQRFCSCVEEMHILATSKSV